MSITLAFDSILNFLSDLAEAFPESLAKPYFEHISDIKAGDKDKQTATVNLFHDFCASNRDEITKGSFEEIKDSTFSFGDSKSFDLKAVFDDSAFAANKDIILKHLLTISALVDKDSNAKQVLISMERESIFNDPSISGLFGKITEDIEKQDLAGTTDPMKMIENLMKSESFGTLVSSLTSKVQNGEINVNNLIGMAALGNGVLGQQATHRQ